MIVGCYTLDLYCDLESEEHEYKEFPHEFTHEFGSRARAEARKVGWILRRNGMAICPKCSERAAQAGAGRRVDEHTTLSSD